MDNFNSANRNVFLVESILLGVSISSSSECDIALLYLQHINSLHSGFKRWIMPFNGVSTKYINNYLACFKFLQLSKNNKRNDRIKDMLVNLGIKDIYITKATIRNRFIELA